MYDCVICDLASLCPSLLVHHCLSLILFVTELIVGNLYSRLYYYYLEIFCGLLV